jgi:hypothetical protein
MKIDSGLNGYYYQNRTPETERNTEEAAPREAASVSRFPDAMTGSSTFLSSSLANALWVMESGDAAASAAAEQMPPLSQDWVQEVYQEFN